MSNTLNAYEEMLDILAFDAARQQAGETFPADMVARLIRGEAPLRVYREYRGLTQQALADASGVSREMIAMIETRKKKGSLTSIHKLATALGIGIEDLA